MSCGALLYVHGRGEPALVRALSECDNVHVQRRCADHEELLAAAGAGLAGLAVVDASTGLIDAHAVDYLVRLGLAVCVLAHPDDVDRTQSLGAHCTVARDVPAGELAERIDALAQQWNDGQLPAPSGVGGAGQVSAGAASERPRTAPAPDSLPVGGRVIAEPLTRRQIREQARSQLSAAPPQPPAPPAVTPATPPPPAKPGQWGEGRVIGVYGPPGSHGRSTVAAALAHLLGTTVPTLLIDADLACPSLTTRLGVLEDVSGMAAMSRRANQGRLTPELLRDTAVAAAGCDLLTGIGRARRFAEVAPVTVAPIMRAAASAYRMVVVDLAATVWPQGDSYEQFAVQPAHIQRELLQACDQVLHVCSADADGIHRLIGHVEDYSLSARDLIVINAIRASVTGARPERAVRDALARFTTIEQAIFLPDDRRACDAALLAAHPVSVAAPHSSLTTALRALAQLLLGAPLTSSTKRRWRRTGDGVSRQMSGAGAVQVAG
ncbi:MAG: hypothetical protein Q4B12_08075 [Bowdeniella nasicola]|nr:hypothetical protein [Bowdeniella nasicola]